MSEEKTLSETVAEKLKEITDNVPYVYQSGVEAGRKAEYDAFWDAYQQNGTKTNYSYAFSQFTTDIHPSLSEKCKSKPQ